VYKLFSDNCLEIIYPSTRPQYTSILYIDKGLFRKQLWDRSLCLCLYLSLSPIAASIFLSTVFIRSLTFMRCGLLGRVNFQSIVLILLRSVMYTHGAACTLAYFCRRLLKELQRAAIIFLLSVYLPVHPHEITRRISVNVHIGHHINMCEKNLTFVW
jgi:hypothetical protein